MDDTTPTEELLLLAKALAYVLLFVVVSMGIVGWIFINA